MHRKVIRWPVTPPPLPRRPISLLAILAVHRLKWNLGKEFRIFLLLLSGFNRKHYQAYKHFAHRVMKATWVKENTKTNIELTSLRLSSISFSYIFRVPLVLLPCIEIHDNYLSYLQCIITVDYHDSERFSHSFQKTICERMSMANLKAFWQWKRQPPHIQPSICLAPCNVP